MSTPFEPTIVITPDEEGVYSVSVTAWIPRNYSFVKMGNTAEITEDYNPLPTDIQHNLTFELTNSTPGQDDSPEGADMNEGMNINAVPGDKVEVHIWSNNDPTIQERKKSNGTKEVSG